MLRSLGYAPHEEEPTSNYQDQIEGHGRRARAGRTPPRDARLLYLLHTDRTAKGPDRKASWSLGLESNGGARGGCGWYLRQAPPHPPTKVTPDIGVHHQIRGGV